MAAYNGIKKVKIYGGVVVIALDPETVKFLGIVPGDYVSIVIDKVEGPEDKEPPKE